MRRAEESSISRVFSLVHDHAPERSRRLVRVSIGALAALSGLAISGIARADSIPTDAGDSLPAHPRAGGDEPNGSEPGQKEEKEPRWTVGADMTLGWGKTETLVTPLPTTLATTGTPFLQDSKTNTQSFIAFASYELIPHLEVGLRLPFGFASFSNGDFNVSNGGTALGNIELEGAYELKLGKLMELEGGLGLATPTSSGEELPTTDDIAKNPNVVSPTNANQYSTNQAESAARGWEDTALYESKRLGLVPKVQLNVHPGKFRVQPYVKVENMFSVETVPQPYIGEFVAGVRVAYAVMPMFEPGIRAWTNVELKGPGNNPVGVLEPEVRANFGPLSPKIGVVIPFAGPLADSGYVGVRIALLGRF